MSIVIQHTHSRALCANEILNAHFQQSLFASNVIRNIHTMSNLIQYATTAEYFIYCDPICPLLQSTLSNVIQYATAEEHCLSNVIQKAHYFKVHVLCV